MAATAASEASDGPVLNLINKRLRALRKKQNRIAQMEESLAQGKVLNKEQEGVLSSKPAVSAQIEELEKLRQPLAAAVAEEIAEEESRHQTQVEELLNLLYFGSLFDVKPQGDFTSIMYTRTLERGCCLTYDTVTDDDSDQLGEKDLDLISSLSGLLISRPKDSSLSHKNALQRCIEHAKLWLAKSDQPIEPNASVTYAGLRERLSKIMALDYFTTSPKMKAPDMAADYFTTTTPPEMDAPDMAAAAGNFAPFQVGVISVDGSVGHLHQQKDEETPNLQGHETNESRSIPIEETQKDEYETENSAEVVSGQQQEQVQPETEVENNLREAEFEQQNGHRRQHQNQRGGRGGSRRGYSNGRGGRGRGGGPYQNGRNQFYDQPGNYYPRNNYPRGRGGRGSGPPYNNHGSAAQEGHASANIGVAS